MDSNLEINTNDIFNIYFMYLELFSTSLKSAKTDEAKEYFYKVAKYFEIIYEYADEKQKLESLKNFRENFEKIKQKAKEKLNITEIHLQDSGLDYIETLLQINNEDSYTELSKFLNENGAYVSAVYFFRKVLEINPDNYDNYIIIGNYCIDCGDYKEAIKYFEIYSNHSPEVAEIYDVLGVLYSNLDRYDNFDLRLDYFKKALEFSPDNLDFLRHLAITYRHMGDDVKCLEIFEKILKTSNTSNDYFDYSIQKLKMGDFENGLKFYEHRFTRETSTIFYPKTNKPKWDGKIDLKDKVLLVQKEQGRGDSIQFVRYLLELKAKKVIFRVHDDLVDLFQKNFKNIEFVPNSTPIEDFEFDYHIALESLLYVLDAKVENIPLAEGYLKADKNLVNEYNEKYFNNDKIKIGIAWSGLRGGNDYRNIDLKSLLTLTELENVKVYSFQKDTRGELEKYIESGADIVNLGETFKDFSDTAAALDNIDIFVTSDNVVSHLAGAMGKNTFLLLNKDSNWRWFMEGDHCTSPKSKILRLCSGRPTKSEKRRKIALFRRFNTGCHETLLKGIFARKWTCALVSEGEISPWYNSFTILRKNSEKQSWDSLIKKVVDNIKNHI